MKPDFHSIEFQMFSKNSPDTPDKDFYRGIEERMKLCGFHCGVTPMGWFRICIYEEHAADLSSLLDPVENTKDQSYINLFSAMPTRKDISNALAAFKTLSKLPPPSANTVPKAECDAWKERAIALYTLVDKLHDLLIGATIARPDFGGLTSEIIKLIDVRHKILEKGKADYKIVQPKNHVSEAPL